MKRVFIAINLPEEVKNRLEEIKNEIIASFPNGIGNKAGKWVKKENLHITLLFLGNVRDVDISRICEIVKEAVAGLRPFSLKFERVCYGPPRAMPPRLIWVEMEKNLEISKLAEVLKQKMAQVDILRKIENRPFAGHITLGRIRAWQWKQIEPEERPEVDREIDLSFEVDSIDVMESRLKRSGAEYAILQNFQFSSPKETRSLHIE